MLCCYCVAIVLLLCCACVVLVFVSCLFCVLPYSFRVEFVLLLRFLLTLCCFCARGACFALL